MRAPLHLRCYFLDHFPRFCGFRLCWFSAGSPPRVLCAFCLRLFSAAVFCLGFIFAHIFCLQPLGVNGLESFSQCLLQGGQRSNGGRASRGRTPTWRRAGVIEIWRALCECKAALPNCCEKLANSVQIFGMGVVGLHV